MAELTEKRRSPFGWERAGNYYLGLATGVIGISECADSFAWLLLMLFTTLICVVSFLMHSYGAVGSKNRILYCLNRYGWIPVCIVAIAYMMKYKGLYCNPFFILLMSLIGMLAPIWWLRKGDSSTIKIYSVYVLLLIVFWAVVHLVPVHIDGTIITRCYYALMMVAFIWMLLISPKVFAKYDGYNMGLFMLFWIGVILLDLILFQVLPFLSDGTPLFTVTGWLK